MEFQNTDKTSMYTDKSQSAISHGSSLPSSFILRQDITKMQNSEMIRNFKPTEYNETRNGLAEVLSKSDQFWHTKNKKSRKFSMTTRNTERVSLKVKNVASNGRIIVTNQEYFACMKIRRAFRTYKLRQEISRRIIIKKFLFTGFN